jgi:hypothetical protein
VLAAVHFDHQASIEAEKIRDKRSNRNLPPEFHPIETAIAQGKPQFPLRVGQARPQCAGRPLTRLAPSALGTHSREGRGWKMPRRHHAISIDLSMATATSRLHLAQAPFPLHLREKVPERNEGGPAH